MNASVAKAETNIPEIIPESAAIAEFKPFEANLAEYKARYQDVVYDMTDKKQEKQARSDRLAIGKVVAELDRVHAAVKAPLLEQVRILDGERKRIKDDLQAVQGGIKRQIEEHEAKIQAVEDALIARVDAISAMAVFESDPTSDDVMKRILQLKKLVVDDSFAHYQAKAETARQAANTVLSALYDKVAQAESDAAELERLRQDAAERERTDREARIAAEAAEKATRDAEEKAERERQARAEADRIARETHERALRQAREAEERAKQQAVEAAARAEEERQRAERQSAEAAERAEREKREAVARAEADARRQAEAAEKARLEAIELERREREAREADQAHRDAVDNAAIEVLVTLCSLTPSAAKAIVTAIASGLVPAIKIEY